MAKSTNFIERTRLVMFLTVLDVMVKVFPLEIFFLPVSLAVSLTAVAILSDE